VADHVGEFLLFPALQALLYTPVTWVLLMGVLWKVWRGWRGLGRPALFLAVFSALPLAPFFMLALRQEVNPNWPAVFYIGLFGLLGAWFSGALFGGLSGAWRLRTLVVAGVFAVATYLLPLLIEVTGAQGRKPVDVFVDLRGWEEAGRQAQYEVWDAPTDKVGWDALVIYPDSDIGLARKPLTTHFSSHFREVEVLGEIRVPIGDGKPYSAQVVLCKNMKRWPPPVPAVAPSPQAP
jgi:hypothetical protein